MNAEKQKARRSDFFNVAGVRGFEPRNAGIRIRALPLGDTPTGCTYKVSVLNNWLGYEDSNLGMPESESGAFRLAIPQQIGFEFAEHIRHIRIWWLRRDSNL